MTSSKLPLVSKFLEKSLYDILMSVDPGNFTVHITSSFSSTDSEMSLG